MAQNQPTPRRLAREVAFQYLYGRFTENQVPDKESFQNFCQSFEFPVDQFGWELVAGTTEQGDAIDNFITQVSKNWRIERMPKVDLAILRLSVYEILHRPDIPKTVAINEAIELAKKFGTEGSASFINGILDKIAKENQG